MLATGVVAADAVELHRLITVYRQHERCSEANALLFNAAFDLMSDITYARSEAVKRNTTITISKASTWTNGWTVDVGATTLRQHPAFSSNITVTMGSSSIDFYLNGRASSLAQFTIDDTGGSASIKARCVSVDPSGRPQSTEGSCSIEPFGHRTVRSAVVAAPSPKCSRRSLAE